MTCRATIELAERDGECAYDAGHDAGHGGPHYCASSKVTWWDESPGASPHIDPAPSYRAIPSPYRGKGKSWVVQTADGDWWREVATFSAEFHPDPEGAAKAEAARLNGEPDDHALLTLDRDGMERALLGERASRVQAEVNLVDAEARAERFRRQRNEAQDAYSQLYEALEEIGAGRFDGLTARFYACRVLREVGP